MTKISKRKFGILIQSIKTNYTTLDTVEYVLKKLNSKKEIRYQVNLPSINPLVYLESHAYRTYVSVKKETPSVTKKIYNLFNEAVGLTNMLSTSSDVVSITKFNNDIGEFDIMMYTEKLDSIIDTLQDKTFTSSDYIQCFFKGKYPTTQILIHTAESMAYRVFVDQTAPLKNLIEILNDAEYFISKMQLISIDALDQRHDIIGMFQKHKNIVSKSLETPRLCNSLTTAEYHSLTLFIVELYIILLNK